jgi:Excreted virulence factor EspC, type VII ESX diderm
LPGAISIFYVPITTQFDPNELGRIAHQQQRLSEETASEGDSVLANAASMLPLTRTASACATYDLAAAAAGQELAHDMAAHAETIQRAAEVYGSTDDELAARLDLES